MNGIPRQSIFNGYARFTEAESKKDARELLDIFCFSRAFKHLLEKRT
jgi:hypothetical protein